MNATDTGPINVPMASIIAALARLGYPESGREDAAVRMSWVPELATDMISYADKGAPKFDPQTGQVPQEVLAPLSDGYTVLGIMTDFLQQPAGAFLLGAALITHHDEAVSMLEKMITSGITVREPDGNMVHTGVPAALKYPVCGVCGEILIHPGQFCGTCGSPIEQGDG